MVDFIFNRSKQNVFFYHQSEFSFTTEILKCENTFLFLSFYRMSIKEKPRNATVFLLLRNYFSHTFLHDLKFRQKCTIMFEFVLPNSGITKRFQRSSLEISFSELHSFLVVRPRPLRYLPNPFPELCGNVRSYTSEGYTFYDNRHKNIVRWLFYKIILVIYIFNLLIIKVSHVDVIVKISIEF